MVWYLLMFYEIEVKKKKNGRGYIISVVINLFYIYLSYICMLLG